MYVASVVVKEGGISPDDVRTSNLLTETAGDGRRCTTPIPRHQEGNFCNQEKATNGNVWGQMFKENCPVSRGKMKSSRRDVAGKRLRCHDDAVDLSL